MKKLMIGVLVVASLMVAAGIVGSMFFSNYSRLAFSDDDNYYFHRGMMYDDYDLEDNENDNDDQDELFDDYDMHDYYSYGMMGARGHGMMGGSGSRYFREDQESVISAEDAKLLAKEYLDENASSEYALSDEVRDYYGYYVFYIEKDEQLIGMLHVDGITGNVWLHDMEQAEDYDCYMYDRNGWH